MNSLLTNVGSANPGDSCCLHAPLPCARTSANVRKDTALWSYGGDVGWRAVRWTHADATLACAHTPVPSIKGGACRDDLVAAVTRMVGVSSQPIGVPVMSRPCCFPSNRNGGSMGHGKGALHACKHAADIDSSLLTFGNAQP